MKKLHEKTKIVNEIDENIQRLLNDFSDNDDEVQKFLAFK